MLPEGTSQVISTRLWASQVMFAQKLSRQEWAKLPVNERAYRICAFKLEGWLASLDMYKEKLEVGQAGEQGR